MNAILALLGSAILAFAVKFFNVLLSWLAKVLAVNPPEAIPDGNTVKQSIDHPGKVQ